MSDNWDITINEEIISEQMKKEAQWWADNRFAKVTEQFPVSNTIFKPMTPEGMKKFIEEMTPTEDITDALKIHYLKVKEAVKIHENTILNAYEMELKANNCAFQLTTEWLAYLYYSKEQHDIRMSKGMTSQYTDHVKKHGQFVKMDSFNAF